MKFYLITLLILFFNFNTCSINNAPKFLSLFPLQDPKPDTKVFITRPAQLVTTESGSTLQFQFFLNRQPVDSVTIDLSLSDFKEGTLDKTSLVFTPTNWDTVQFLTVTGKDDSLLDGDRTYFLLFPRIQSNDSFFAELKLDSIGISNRDNDSPNLVFSQATGLVTNESGTSISFTAVLTSEPFSDVTIPAITSSDATEGSVSPNSLIFTSANWNIPQTITVTSVDDLIDDGNQTYTINFAPSTSLDPQYIGRIGSPVTIVNGDNEALSGFTVGVPVGNTCECGTSVTFNIVLNSDPNGTTTLSLSSSNTNEGTVSPASLNFTSANWNIPQLVTVTGVNDFVQDGNVAYSILINSNSLVNSNYAALAPKIVNLTNTDDDIAGFTITLPTGSLIVADGGQISSQININLNSQPTANVTIPISSTNIGEMTLSVASVTFTPQNWNTIQTITLNGVADGSADGFQSFSVILSIPTTADLIYAAIDPPDQTGNSCDNDTLGTKVSICRLNNNSNASEDLSTVSFYLILNQAPTAPVTVSVTSGDTTEGTVSPATITLDASNYNNLSGTNLVTVTGVDEGLYDGDITYNINFGAATSTDLFFSGYVLSPFPITNIDNEVYFVVSGISGTTSETGTTATFTIRLAAAPTGANTVTIPISSNNTAEGTVSPASVVFNNANFSTNQTITVTGVNDTVADGNIGFTIVTGLAVSGDLRFNGKDPNDVNVTNDDVGEKRTFVTSLTYDGNLGGSTGADAKCNADPSRPGITPNVYKALLVQGAVRRATTTANMSVSPVDWVLLASTRYFQSDGTTLSFLSNANRIFVFGTLTNSFGTGDAWTGISADWTNHANHCTNWSSNSNAVNGRFGSMNVATSSSISSATVTCDQQRSILCVQQ